MEQIAECREKINQIKTTYRLNTIFRIALGKLEQQIAYNTDLLSIKGRLDYLKPYDELVQDEAILLLVFEQEKK